MCAAAGLDLSRAEAVGGGRACQRPRTSSGAKCFSCEGALARELAFFKIFGNYCCAGRSEFVGRAQRGDDKPRGRGRGRRNIFVCCWNEP